MLVVQAALEFGFLLDTFRVVWIVLRVDKSTAIPLEVMGVFATEAQARAIIKEWE